jgi:death-on-curing protein
VTEVDFLDEEDLLAAARRVVGSGVQVRDFGLLASAAARPRATVFGEDAYPGLDRKAAALLSSLARNHPLVDGNKRLAWAATRLFLLMNGGDLRGYTEDEAYDFVIAVAAGSVDEVDKIAEQLRLWLVQR